MQKVQSFYFVCIGSQNKMSNEFPELNEIKEALTPSVNGSIIFERAISVRSSITKIQRYFVKIIVKSRR